MNDHIFIVEDEPKLSRLLADYLRQSGYTPHIIERGDEVIPRVRSDPPAAILLDVMLPGKDGLAVCRELRTFSNVPVLMVTARVEEVDRLVGLELGADDYICKPFSPREVVSRVKAVLRRAQAAGAGPVASGITLDEGRLEMRLDDKAVALTTVEFQLLRQLADQPGRILSRDQLMRGMYADHRIVSDRTIDSHIKKLRRKLGESWPGREFIHSVYGAGYRFDME